MIGCKLAAVAVIAGLTIGGIWLMKNELGIGCFSSPWDDRKMPWDDPANSQVYRILDTLANRGPIQMFFMDHVKPIPGSVVCCKLAGVVEHSGVYVGNGQIVHRDGDGYLAKVGMQEFLERLGGFNPAITIFVSCHKGEPVGGDAIALRALEAMGNPSLSQGYDLLTKNCHQFCQYCVTGKVDNGFTDFTFSNLEGVLQHELDMDSWRVWDGCWRG